MPHVDASQATKLTCQKALLDFEQAAAVADAHTALGHAETLCRSANKIWGQAAKDAYDQNDDKAYQQALADAFYALRATSLMMHPAVFEGCETICDHMSFDRSVFFSWENAFMGPYELAKTYTHDEAAHKLVEIPAHFDFFKKTK